MTGPSKVPTSWAVSKPVDYGCMFAIQDVFHDVSGREVTHGWINQFLYMDMLYNRARRRSDRADVVECGLGEGNTLAMLAYFMKNNFDETRLWGFDSFEGWPEPDPSDASPRNPTKGEWKVSEEMVRTRFKQSTLSLDNVNIVKGFLGETLPNFSGENGIALLHLDVDLYEGYRDALQHLWQHVVPGGVVAFDEYREYHPELPGYMVDGHPVEKWPGCTKAVDEFFASRRNELRGPSPDNDEEKGFVCAWEGFWYHPPTQKYFVVKR